MSGHFSEALVRWQHPTQGLVPPATFIPLAEQNGAIIGIGEWVLHEACREAASWSRPLTVAVNLSAVQFKDSDIPGLVGTILASTGLAPERLELELTETALIGDHGRTLTVLRALKKLGVRVSMDDFGTGFSSLSYLQSFPFDALKIDRSFVMDLPQNRSSEAIVKGVIGLAHALGMPVVAEGVETQEQLEFLSGESCNHFQGYFIGRPQPIAEYAAMTCGAASSHKPAVAPSDPYLKAVGGTQRSLSYYANTHGDCPRRPNMSVDRSSSRTKS